MPLVRCKSFRHPFNDLTAALVESIDRSDQINSSPMSRHVDLSRLQTYTDRQEPLELAFALAT